MARVRSKNTSPEMRLRKVLWSRGLRYRLHSNDLPGKPDIYFRRAGLAVFVHGCFWHSHSGCSRARVPSTGQEYWIPKLQRNVQRDARVQAELRKMGWTVFIAWECAIKRHDKVADEIMAILTDLER